MDQKKRYQKFEKESIEVALSNIQKIIQREENDEIYALYGAGNYCLCPAYQNFLSQELQWYILCPRPIIKIFQK